MGFYFRNVTELLLFGTRHQRRSLAPGRRQVNVIAARKREHSRKPNELDSIVERCSFGPSVELFARHSREGWGCWGDPVDQSPVSKPIPAQRLLFGGAYP